MFPVHAHSILTNKFARSFILNDVCIHKSLKCRKICYKMIFWPEHAEDISSIYLVHEELEYAHSIYLLNQIFESISDL